MARWQAVQRWVRSSICRIWCNVFKFTLQTLRRALDNPQGTRSEHLQSALPAAACPAFKSLANQKSYVTQAPWRQHWKERGNHLTEERLSPVRYWEWALDHALRSLLACSRRTIEMHRCFREIQGHDGRWWAPCSMLWPSSYQQSWLPSGNGVANSSEGRNCLCIDCGWPEWG